MSASAIEQKNTLPAATSVNGNVMDAPSQLPVSACISADIVVRIEIATINISTRYLIWCLLLIILALRLVNIEGLSEADDLMTVRLCKPEIQAIAASRKGCVCGTGAGRHRRER